MIRLIVKELAGDPDGRTHDHWKTFDVELPVIEKYLCTEIGIYGCGSRQIVGAEIIEEPKGGGKKL